MADVQSNETGNIESNRNQETVSKSYRLLRPSAFSSSSATSASRDTESSRENESTSQTPSRFQLRPSMLDKQAASLFNKDVSSSPAVRGSASFKLEPPKLCSPLSCKFTDNNKPSLLRPGSQLLLGNSETAPTGGDGVTPVSGASDGSTTVPTAASTNPDNATQEPASASHLLKVTPLPPTEADGFLFGQQLDARVATTSSEQPVATGGAGLPSVSSLPGGALTTATTATSSAVASGFVFGSNLAERVLAPVATADHTATSGTGGGASDGASQPDTAANSADTSASVSGASEPATTSLEESAALQQAKHSHIQLNEVEVVTGEEDESNVFQFNVKLFVFEKKTQSWLERGVGHLRLNDKCGPCDSGSFQSRLVLRIFGSLRVVLNTMIWADMLIERATQKSIKISAVDPEEGVRIYLIQANPSDADHIYSAISSRAHKLKLAEATRRSPAVGATAAATGAGVMPLHDSPSGTASASSSSTSVATVSTPASEKRSSEVLTDSDTFTGKRRRVDPEQRREQVEDESNDSSAVDPETEASNEGFSSSPPIQSSSSEA